MTKEQLSLVRECQRNLMRAAELAHTLNTEHNITIQFEFGVGPDGKFALRKFQPMVPYDLSKEAS